MIFKFILEVFGWFWGCCGVGRGFLCRMNLELWWKSVWGANYGGFGGSKTFFVYNWWVWKELFNFASMTPHRSAPGSPFKASELDFIILEKSKIGRSGRWEAGGREKKTWKLVQSNKCGFESGTNQYSLFKHHKMKQSGKQNMKDNFPLQKAMVLLWFY